MNFEILNKSFSRKGEYSPEVADHFFEDRPNALLLSLLLEDDLLLSGDFPNRNELEPGSVMYRIIFICDENQGRSQMAAAVAEAFRRWLRFPMPVEIVSAGITATPHKNDGKPDPTVRKRMENMRIDMSKKVVTQLTPNMITENTIVVLLTDLHKLPAYVFEQAKLILANHVGDPSLPGKPLAKDASLSDTLDDTRYIAIFVVYKLAVAMRAEEFSIFTRYFRQIIVHQAEY